MSLDYMLTIPNPDGNRDLMYKFIFWAMSMDSHKWVVGKEVGRGGYQHLQARIRIREEEPDLEKDKNDSAAKATFRMIKERWPTAHIKECSDTWEYERKGGDFICSEDYNEYDKCWRKDELNVRFGKERPEQTEWTNLVEQSDIREIVVLFDENGCVGKTWWSQHWWEVGRAHILTPVGNPKTLIQDVASKFKMQGWRPWLIIDIPKAWDWTDELYFVLEKCKDGLVSDTRYKSNDISIRGVKVVVCCNKLPKVRKMSKDRWLLWDAKENWFIGSHPKNPDNPGTPDDDSGARSGWGLPPSTRTSRPYVRPLPVARC